MSDAKTVKAVVLVDTYAWQEPIPNTNPVQYQRFELEPPEGTSSAKGVEVTVTPEEFARCAKMTPPALAKAGRGNSGASSGGWPTTHDELDKLAEGVDGITVTPGEGKAKSTWNDGAVKSTTEKVTALQAAGVTEPTE